MSLAADTREAVRERPFLCDALRAGLTNYSAAAAWLDDDAELDGETNAIATALRRFREDLPPYTTEDRTASVSMRSGIKLAETGTEAVGVAGTDGEEPPLLRVGDAGLVTGGDDTAVLATGGVDAAALAAVLRRLTAAGVDPVAAGVAGGALIVVVGRREGATAVRVVEAALSAVPVRE